MNLRKFLVLVCVSIGIGPKIGLKHPTKLIHRLLLLLIPVDLQESPEIPGDCWEDVQGSLFLGDLQASLGIFIGSLPPEISEGSGDSDL